MKLRLAASALTGGICCSSPLFGQQPAPSRAVADAEFAQKMEKETRDDVTAAEHLPVDYRECLLPIFLDLMDQEPQTEELRRYVSVFGRDVDSQLQALFAKRGVTVLPASAQPHDPNDGRTHTPEWSYGMVHLVAEPLGQYSVDAGYHCGALCNGVFHYTFRIVGKTCGITSKDMRWVS